MGGSEGSAARSLDNIQRWRDCPNSWRKAAHEWQHQQMASLPSTHARRSQTSNSGTGGGQWICGAIMARFDSRAAPSTERARVPRAGWAKGWMATRSCKLRGEAVPYNGYNTAFPVTKALLRSQTSGRSSFLCFALFSPDVLHP